MAKAKKCKLIFHGKVKQFDMGTFPSIAKAKKYLKECWNGPYTIIIL
jgi:tRNA A37 threonylcarbamoyladenosine synthetase subunit TsaC/SUA5/YrdC